MGGVRLVYVLDGEESVAHFEADQFGTISSCCWTVSESDRISSGCGRILPSDEDPDDPAATDEPMARRPSPYFDRLTMMIEELDLMGTMFFGRCANHAKLCPWVLQPMREKLMLTCVTSITLMANHGCWGDLSLEADFDGSTVSGTIDGVASHPGNEGDFVLAPGNSIAISNGMIDAGGFTADWRQGRMNAARNETVSGFAGTMVGEFYGPAAEEVGGVMRGQRAADGSSSGSRGVFGASQPEPEVEQ